MMSHFNVLVSYFLPLKSQWFPLAVVPFPVQVTPRGSSPSGIRHTPTHYIRNATEITSPSDLLYRPSSVLRQQLHSWAMRLLSRLEYERSFDVT
jgi:hypothetical protein